MANAANAMRSPAFAIYGQPLLATAFHQRQTCNAIGDQDRAGGDRNRFNLTIKYV